MRIRRFAIYNLLRPSYLVTVDLDVVSHLDTMVGFGKRQCSAEYCEAVDIGRELTRKCVLCPQPRLPKRGPTAEKPEIFRTCQKPSTTPRSKSLDTSWYEHHDFDAASQPDQQSTRIFRDWFNAPLPGHLPCVVRGVVSTITSRLSPKR